MTPQFSLFGFAVPGPLLGLLRRAGVDRAVAWSIASQLLRFVTGPVTMLLVLHFFTPDVQGYYYTFGSVLALSVFLEMGFSQNIVQFTAHEYAHLSFGTSGSLEGDPAALSRLTSLGRLSFAYYLVAAGLFAALVGTGGYLFFLSGERTAVPWEGAWWILCVSSSVSLAINPAWAFLEGCNQVAPVAIFRFVSTIIGFACTAAAMAGGAGIYTAAIAGIVSVIMSIAYLGWRWGGFFTMFSRPPTGPVISWRKEIWPFQWRIALSWTSGYFIFSIIAPVVFRLRGAADAGRAGMTFQLVRMIGTIAGAWAATKVPQFGALASRKDWQGLNDLWRQSTRRSLFLCALGQLGLVVAVVAAHFFIPTAADRLASPFATAAMGAGVVTAAAITCLAYYLRAFKREVFVVLSLMWGLANAALVTGLCWLFGVDGAACGFLAAALIVTPYAFRLFRFHRRKFTSA